MTGMQSSTQWPVAGVGMGSDDPFYSANAHIAQAFIGIDVAGSACARYVDLFNSLTPDQREQLKARQGDLRKNLQAITTLLSGADGP